MTLIRRQAALLPLAIVLALTLAIVLGAVVSSNGPNGRAFAGDFALFMGAAQAVRDGASPYDRHALSVASHRLLSPQHVRLAPAANMGVGNPPLLFWCMEPLTDLSFRTAAWIWMAAMYMLSAAGAYLLLGFMGWTKWAVPLAMFLAFPQVVLGVFYGQVDGLIFAAICLGLVIAPSHPGIAGAVFGLVFFKPSVGVPIVLLILLFHVRRPLPAWLGLAISTTVLSLLTVLTTGWAVALDWLHELVGHPGKLSTLGDVAPLAGAYARSLGATPRAALDIASLLAATAVTVYMWRRWRSTALTVLQTGWLWVVWFLAMPFGHFHDEILLAPPLLAALGRDGDRLVLPESLVPLYILALSTPLVYFIPGGIQLLWAPLVICGVCLTIAARREQPGQVIP